MNVYLVTCNENTAVIILQDSMDLLKVEPDLGDESEVIDVKVEDITDVKEEEDPLLITLPVTDIEHEVSCMSAFNRYTDVIVRLVNVICLRTGKNCTLIGRLSRSLPLMPVLAV
jgi:hypothetical protein